MRHQGTTALEAPRLPRDRVMAAMDTADEKERDRHAEK